jgi:hypothetical protein
VFNRNGPSQNKVLGLVLALLYCNVREESGNHGSPELHRVIPQGAIQPGRRTSEGGLPLGATRYYLIQVIPPAGRIRSGTERLEQRN